MTKCEVYHLFSQERKVPKTGFEPARPYERCSLKAVRLPISPLGLSF